MDTAVKPHPTPAVDAAGPPIEGPPALVSSLERSLRKAAENARIRIGLARWTGVLSILPWGLIMAWGCIFMLRSDFAGITMSVEDPVQVMASLIMYGVPLLLLAVGALASMAAAIFLAPRSYRAARRRFQQSEEIQLFVDDELLHLMQARLHKGTHGWTKPTATFKTLADRLTFSAYHHDNLRRLRRNPEAKLLGTWMDELARTISPLFAKPWLNWFLGLGLALPGGVFAVSLIGLLSSFVWPRVAKANAVIAAFSDGYMEPQREVAESAAAAGHT